MLPFASDLRFAIRQLRRSPGFSLLAIVTMALAIGVSTAVFSVLDAMVVRPLPYKNPDSIVVLRTWSPQGYGQPASWLQYLDWRRENKTLSALAGYGMDSINMESGQSATPVRAVSGTDNFFDVFGVQPMLGRTFRTGEDKAGHNDVVVLSYELWKQTFGADRNIVGSKIRLDGTPTEVIGVMPAGFRYPLSVSNALYRPFHLPATRIATRGQHFLPTIGRLKDGVTMSQAEADMGQVFQNLGRLYPDEAGRRVHLLSESEASLGKTGGPLRVLVLSVFGVLIIGCVNIAGLLLVRGVRRQREFALRSAIGAGRGRIVRQLLTESAVLSLAGAAGGVLLAAGMLQVMRQLLISSLSRGADVELNLPVLAAAVVIALVTGLTAGTLPALQFSRLAPAMALRSGGAAGSSLGQNRLRFTLIAVQIAIAMGLLVCSGLLLRNLHDMRSTSLGFSPDKLLTEEVTLTAANYVGRDMVTSFYNPLLERVRALPGVAGAGMINLLPIQESGSNGDMHIVGKPPLAPNQEMLAEIRSISPGALEAIGAHLIKGRTISGSVDHAGAPINVTVNEAFVHKFFSPGEEAVGRQIDWGNDKITIVGVMSNLRQDLGQPSMAEMDLPAAQIPAEYASSELLHMTLVVQVANGDPASVSNALREAMHQIDPSVPFRAPLTMNQVVAETLTFERLESWLFGIFAVLALTLSLVGIYGMVHHEVELQTRDIGIRMALGSSRTRVVRQILTRVTLLLTAGLGCGWLLTLAMQRTISSVVELHATQNASLLGGLTLVLAFFGVAAGLLPARRAASISPTEALRAE
ncbi:ABC transporter permease [Granulicella tundricola]|uniref:Permease n=1 Tax=Granulicella tundricola (strain ATCC BAA-1859 / DSM 23138 / MP5ACTX9) TaxID=1198114 RepID=E8WY93_GRATM|nr:ABC transporter permease [Granulicella tundricola]ADW68720.1 permease [Granulicella tundricola MP5ACTX9]